MAAWGTLKTRIHKQGNAQPCAVERIARPKEPHMGLCVISIGRPTAGNILPAAAHGCHLESKPEAKAQKIRRHDLRGNYQTEKAPIAVTHIIRRKPQSRSPTSLGSRVSSWA